MLCRRHKLLEKSRFPRERAQYYKSWTSSAQARGAIKTIRSHLKKKMRYIFFVLIVKI